MNATPDPCPAEGPAVPQAGVTWQSELAAFQNLMERIRAGSDDAARELLIQYGPHVIRVVRRKLSKELRPKFDSMDFAQAVWASFYSDRTGMEQLDRPETLIGRLVEIAKNKVIDEYRRRDRQEGPGAGRDRPIPLDGAFGSDQPVERAHTPSQEAMAHDLWRKLVAGQPADLQEIVRLRLVGLTCDEIAGRLDMDSRSVRRRLDELFEERNR